MSVPGSNLLNLALTVIAPQTVTYYKALQRTLNDVGQDVTLYAPAVYIQGSFQPISKSLYEVYGLDFQKTYAVFYTPTNVIDVQRDVSADQIIFDGKRYQCESNNNWYPVDGWVGVLCVMVGKFNPDVDTFGFNEVPTINDNENYSHGNFPQDTEN